MFFGRVADVEGSDDVPVGFGSYGGAYVGETGLAGTPADSDSERVGGQYQILNGAGGGCVVFVSYFVVAALNRVGVHKRRGIEDFLLGFSGSRNATFWIGIFYVLEGPIVDDLCDFFAHCTVFGENDKSPRFGVSVVWCPGCGFDY